MSPRCSASFTYSSSSVIRPASRRRAASSRHRKPCPGQRSRAAAGRHGVSPSSAAKACSPAAPRKRGRRAAGGSHRGNVLAERMRRRAGPRPHIVGALIEGVTVHPLRQIPDERGKVMHMLRADDPHFEAFGEIYFSVVELGAIKAWHLHERMTINYAVPLREDQARGLRRSRRLAHARGDRGDLPRRGELRAGDGSAVRLERLQGHRRAPRDRRELRDRSRTTPTEIVRLDPFSEQIPYDWSLKHG